MKMTGKLLLATAAVAALSGTAMAADLYVPPSQPAPVYQAPAATDWDGPYIGASLGYAWGTADASTVPDTATINGWMVGGQVGYNFHLTNNVVTGLEADLNWTNEKGDFSTAGVSFQKNWDASLRGRLGIDLDGVLPYVEAGVAFANATVTDGGVDSSGSYTGWTAGAGVEFKLADQLSANVEYRYNNYGDQTLDANTVSLTDNVVKAGLNYHF